MKARKSRYKLQPSDVPQADTLATVRALVYAVSEIGADTKVIAKATGFSERHVQYRSKAAQVLGLLDHKRSITERGFSLLATAPSSEEERKALSNAVSTCQVVSLACPDLLSRSAPDRNRLANAIARATGMATNTASRRARTLLSWRRQVLGDGKSDL